MGRALLLRVFLVAAAIASLWTIVAGKDVNWDQLNYHYYAPFALLHSRLSQDFFAASAQSYLNPVGYLPFYLMVSSGWHSVAVSIVLAVAHSVSVALLFLVAWKLFAHLRQQERLIWSSLATVMGLANGVYWASVGSSFLDPLLAPLVLGGMLFLLDAQAKPMRCAALAGALFGAAAALKYSNVVYVPVAIALAAAMPGLSSTAARLRNAAAGAAGAMVAVALFAGPWLYLMQREFGNPVFPLMNGWFHSPHAPATNLIAARFVPEDLASALSFPFRMATLDRSLYTETFAPDLRFAALLAGVFALPVLTLRSSEKPGPLRAMEWRVLSFFAACAVLWLFTSANARYGLPVLLLAGVCLARIVERLLPAPGARIVFCVLLAAQLITSALAAPARWFLAEPWSSRWLPYDAPPRALQEPALYLSVELLPMAVVAPFLHPDSSLVNLRGQHSLPPDSPRLAALIERHRGRVRTLGRRLELAHGRPAEATVAAYDATLTRIGYRVDTADCFTLAWRPDTDDPVSRAANAVARADRVDAEPLSVVSCALISSPPDVARLEQERQMSALFDRIERSCPGLFRGQTAVTEPLGRAWSRHYPGLDARLEADSERVVLNRYRRALVLDLGRPQDWQPEGRLLEYCARGVAKRGL